MKGLVCGRCGTVLVHGRKLTKSEKKATSFIAPSGSDYVFVCPKCYPEKVGGSN